MGGEWLRIAAEIFLPVGRLGNWYHIPQFLWLTELYYLVINALWEMILHFWPDAARVLPEAIDNGNRKILSMLHQWDAFLMFTGIILFISGKLVPLVAKYPVISRYPFIRKHAQDGRRIAIWVFLLGAAHVAYTWSGMWFPFLIMGLFVLFYRTNSRR